MTELKGFRILAVLAYEVVFGGERANIKVMQLLRRRGAEVQCIVLKDGGEAFLKTITNEGFIYHRAGFGPSVFGLSGNPVHYTKNLLGMLRVSSQLLKILRIFKPTHIYVPNYIQFLYIWPALFFTRVPVIFRTGDIPETTKLHRFLWNKIISPKVVRFVANSKYTLNLLYRAGISRDKGLVINNCLTRYDQQFNINKNILGKYIVTYVGRLDPQKGLDIAIDAAIAICSLRNDVIFKFVGPVDQSSGYLIEQISKVKNSNLQEEILFPGFTNDVMSILRNSSIHICSSVKAESSANVVIEAKASGLPSIVFPIGGLPELIAHKKDGYICRAVNMESLIEGISYFLDSHDKLKKAGIAAKQSASAYSECNIAPAWCELLKSTAVISLS